jgi:hypothetical protein
MRDEQMVYTFERKPIHRRLFKALASPKQSTHRAKAALRFFILRNSLYTALDTFSRHIGRSVGTTQNGYVAWLPQQAKTSDLICFLPCSDIPFVLRFSDVEDGYLLIGDCYVHGLMDGNRQSLDPQPEPATIKLR